RSPLVIRPLLTSPQRATPSRAPPSRTTPRTTRTGHLEHPWRPPRIRPATFIAHPPRLRTGPLMDIGLRLVGANSPGPTRLIRAARPARHADRPDHVFLGSRLRTPASSPPSLTTEQLPSACGWCHQPPQGTRTPELLVMSRAHRACGSLAHGSPTFFTVGIQLPRRHGRLGRGAMMVPLRMISPKRSGDWAK